MTDEDRECLWRMAFAYADSFVSTDEAVRFADYYMKRADADPDYDAGFDEVFNEFAREEDNEREQEP